MNPEVVDLARRRQQRELDAALRAIRRAVDVPDKLIDDVLGPDVRHFEMAERLTRATGLRWPAPGTYRTRR